MNISRLLTTLLLITLNENVNAQTQLEENLGKILNTSVVQDYTKSYLRGYMKPFVTAFGTCVSGAMYHRGYTKGFPRFDVGVCAVHLIIPENGKVFNEAGGNEVPTIFGSKTNQFDSLLPGGTETDYFLVPQLHINLGLFADFEVTARYLGLNIKELGDIALLGMGIKYGMGDFPLNMSIQAMYHTFRIDNWLNSGTIGMNLQVSKGLPAIPIELYGGIGFENTSMTLSTNKIPGVSTDNIGDISIDGDNNYRVNIGISWTLLIINLHAEYNFGTYNSIGAGAMLVF